MKALLNAAYNKLFPRPPQPEPLMYRIELFGELMALAPKESFAGKRILEIGPKDGLDTQRLADLKPSELVLLDLPDKREGNEKWLDDIPGEPRYVEGNYLYMSAEEQRDLGSFDLIWFTGVLYHNAEQMRMLRTLYKQLNVDGYLVLESATLRGSPCDPRGAFVEVFYPQTYRDTGSITHLPSAGAIRAWLDMAGFNRVHDSRCYEKYNRDLADVRYACVAHKTDEPSTNVYYQANGLNPDYQFGDST